MPTVGVLGVVAGVEEIGGLDGPVPSGSGMGVLLGSRTATPRWFPLWRGSDAHAEYAGCPVMGPAGTCGAWRFENWIVDASKGNNVSFCLSRFRQTLYF